MRKATATAARVVPWPKDGAVPPPGPDQPLGRGLSAVVDRITGDVEPLGGAALDPALEDPAVLLRGLGVLVEDEAAELERQRVAALEEEVSDLRAEVHLLRGRLAEVEADVDARVAAARAGAEHARLGEARRQVAGFRLLSILETNR